MSRGKRFVTARFHSYNEKTDKKDCSTEDCKPKNYALQKSMQKRKERNDAIRRNPELSRDYYYYSYY